MSIFRNSKYERRYKKSSNQFEDQEDNVQGILRRISSGSRDAYNDAEMGFDERYGDSLGRVRDSVADDRAGAQRTISRALMASGGDVTGKGATALSGVTESGNEAISDAIRGYSDMNESTRRFDLNRGDNLISRELSGNENLLNMTLGQMMNAQNLELQRKTANKQFLADVIGSVFSALGGGDKSK